MLILIQGQGQRSQTWLCLLNASYKVDNFEFGKKKNPELFMMVTTIDHNVKSYKKKCVGPCPHKKHKDQINLTLQLVSNLDINCNLLYYD